MKKNELLIEIAFLVIFFVVLICWVLVQPYNVSPDEYMRFQICEFIYNNHSLPHGGEISIRNPIWGYSYGFFPLLSYMISAVFMWIMSWFSTDGWNLLVAARMVSVFFGVGTAWFVIRIGKKICPKKCGWIFLLLVTLLPQMMFLFSYVNNDAIALFSTAMIIYMWIIGMESCWNYKSCIGLALGISICALSYYNAYGIILCSILLYLLWFWKNRETERKKFWIKSSIIVTLVLICIGWWFVRNYQLYDGDFLGIATSEEYSQTYGSQEWKPSNRISPYNQEESIYQLLIENGWLKTVVKSFIGYFGYLTIPLFNSMYVGYIVIFFIGIVGALWDWKRIYTSNPLLILGLLLSIIIPNGLNLYHSYMIDFQPQGRYSMPCIIGLMYFIAMGWNKIVCFFIKKEKMQQYTLRALQILICSLAMCSYLFVFFPFYY